uniref:Uncharacterized protein n=1 Tax=Chromera velia CCMP2878 TaxID=1169474 RepID=A0A0G4HEB4_9ALVE|eukprot:Cvel_6495.t1-p1 / transcript=Cvel_6495.t1 / gene=Cvel_6495 / organism=Chromera_velia_CCMP2878 / gene_product=hypothetical protein / transcript_product=hypothetical protein / location=Cvel_scaffold318:91491-92240(-) / protein_length=250 / sequence_SO=supercontig / SO=protein_coding / is_pseudo=false
MAARNAAALVAVQQELEAVVVSLLEVVGMVQNMGRIVGTYNTLPVSDGEGDGSLHPPAAAAAAATGSFPVVPPQESAALAELRQQVETMRKGARVQLNRIINARCCMDLSPLFVYDIGNVILSFVPIGADQLHEKLDEFFEADGEEERRAKREDFALLLHVGADVDGVVDNDTALIKAVKAYDGGLGLEAAKILVGAGVGVDVRNSASNSALHVGTIVFEIAEFLVTCGGDVIAEKKKGGRPLSIAAEYN